MSSPNQTPDQPVTLEDIREEVTKLGEDLFSLRQAISDLQGETAKNRSLLKVNSLLPLACAVIAGAATIIAAVSTFFAGSMTANTSTALTRLTTLQSENAKKDVETYQLAQHQIAILQQAFETFLQVKKLYPQTAQLGTDLDAMCTEHRFGNKTTLIKEYNDFIFTTMFALQHDPELWKKR